MQHSKILILDFGSQVTQLIARRVREAHVFCEVHPCDVSSDWVREFAADGRLKGVILSGSHASVYEVADKAPDAVFELGIPVLGIEPAANVAEVARQKGITTIAEFFGKPLATRLLGEGMQADLLLGNNVLAHVPDLNDFVAGMKQLLKPTGTVTMEFPHLLRLMQQTQFDTIYHEHFSYFSLHTVSRVFDRHGLVIFDVEELPTHGGSLRIFAAHAGKDQSPASPRMQAVLAGEKACGLHAIDGYKGFANKVQACKRELLKFLIGLREQGRTIAGYGAPAKGNTLLNYCGVREDLLEYTVDMSPHKQGKYLPGTHIPVYHPDILHETRPDYVLILPWNLSQEITSQLAIAREWGCRFVVPVPTVRVLP